MTSQQGRKRKEYQSSNYQKIQKLDFKICRLTKKESVTDLESKTEQQNEQTLQQKDQSLLQLIYSLKELTLKNLLSRKSIKHEKHFSRLTNLRR